jgi:hypothetical protein
MKKSIAVGVASAAGALAVLASLAVAAAPARSMGSPRAPGGQAQIGAGSNISGWAVVDSDGTLVRKLNAVAATRLSQGNYLVEFNSKLNRCAFTATIGHPGTGTAPAGFITTASFNGIPRAVYVQTQDTTGAIADRPFHLEVSC